MITFRTRKNFPGSNATLLPGFCGPLAMVLLLLIQSDDDDDDDKMIIITHLHCHDHSQLRVNVH